MSRNIALKKLPKPRQHHPATPPPLALPDLSPSLSALTPTTTAAAQTQLTQLTTLLKTHLKKSPIAITPEDLLHFLKSRLRHHPTLSHLDFHLFRYAATLDSFRHDHSTFEYMVRSLVSTSRLDSLPSLLEFISSNPCPCSDGIFSCPKIEPMFRVSISSFCRAGRFDDALFAFDIMKRLIDGKPNVALYNIVIHGFVKFGKLDRAVEFYGRMVRERVKPDAVTFNILISGYCRNNKFGLALEVFKEMKEKGCVPNVVSFNTLIKGFFQDGKVEQAVGMAREMIELGCEFSCVTTEILIDGLGRKGKATEAADLMVEFLKKGVLPRGFDYLGLVEMLCVDGNVERASELMDEFWAEGYAPILIACTTLIERLCGVGRTERSVELMRKMLNEGLVPDSVTFSCLLQDMCGTGGALEANKLRLLACRKGLDSDGMMYRILISGCMKEGRRKEGEVLVNEMLDRGFIPDIATYNMMMEGLAKSKGSLAADLGRRFSSPLETETIMLLNGEWYSKDQDDSSSYGTQLTLMSLLYVLNQECLLSKAFCNSSQGKQRSIERNDAKIR
ncbi:Pentatricopeptide repeat-containing protein [Sesamum angolense]|uniref:Pentatricopeptide repeat-containing protein n=1 Tax=Sesamum angolense TaxID=2727404 RepID=A0AAE1WNS4_9LAMI|nr:Pentatricopeptide repeat-containing protein [Sesamum angolense]